jgi:hypothetical protein
LDGLAVPLDSLAEVADVEVETDPDDHSFVDDASPHDGLW